MRSSSIEVLVPDVIVGPHHALGGAGEVLELAAGVAAVAVAGLLGVHEADLREHAADEDFLIAARSSQSWLTACVEKRCSIVLVLGQRMAGDVEVERFLLVLQLLGGGPFGDVGQARRCGLRPPSPLPRFERLEQIELAVAAVLLDLARRLEGAGQRFPELRRGWRQCSRTRRP